MRLVSHAHTSPPPPKVHACSPRRALSIDEDKHFSQTFGVVSFARPRYLLPLQVRAKMAESPACDAGASTATHSSRHVDLVVKLGGAAITHKGSEVEHLNEPVLRSVAQTIAQTIQELRTEGGCPNVVVVHGAGSFGHQFAKQYGVASGGNGTLRVGTDDSSNRRLRLGIAKTRASVCRLNSLVVAALVDAGVNAVGVSPYGGWWTRDGGKTLDLARTKPAIDSLRRTVDAGLVAVVHGDVVLDSKSDCAILSGDTIVRQLCFDLKPKRAVFVTDVPGIFDKPPPKPNGGKRKRSAKNSETLSLLREVCLTPPSVETTTIRGTPRASPWVLLLQTTAV